MPLIKDTKQTLALRKYTGVDEIEADHSTGDIFKAAFSTDNTIGSLIALESGLPDIIVNNEDFNPWNHISEEEKADDIFIDSVMLADTPQEIEAVRKQRQNEQSNRKILSESGALGFIASLSAGVADPINLIPVGGTAYKTYKGGAGILKAGLVTGSVAAGSAAAQEAALHKTQIERTYGESAANVGGAFLLGAILGSGSNAIREKLLDPKVADDIERSLSPEEFIAKGEDSVGAAKVFDEIQIKGKIPEAMAKAIGFDPLSRTLTSQSQASRRLANELAENPYLMDAEPVQAVESFIKQWDGGVAESIEESMSQLKAFRKRTGQDQFLKGLKRKEWNQMVSREIRNPNPNAAPEIKAAAKAFTEKVYEPLKREAIEAKLLPDDVSVDTAAQYLNRVWDKNKVAAQMPRFVDKVSLWLKRQNDDLIGNMAKMKRQLESLDPKADAKSIAELEESISKAEFKESLDLDIQDFEEVASDIAGRIMGTPDGRLPYDWKLGDGSSNRQGFSGTKLRGPLRSRSFNIPDELVEEFLENDIEVLSGRYIRSIAPDIELTKRFGDVEMKAQLKEVEVDWRKKIDKEKDPKKRVKLNRQKEKDIADIADMRDRIRGVYGQVDARNPWVRTGRAIRDLNYLRFMGGVVASSVPDVARTFAAEGFVKTFNKGLKPLIANTKAFKMAAKEVKSYNASASALMGGRGEIIADIADYTAGGTAIERGLRTAAENFGRINLMDNWTAAMKQLHGVTMQTSVIDDLMKGKVDKRLARLGLNSDQIADITKELQEHATKIDGVWLSNANKWSDAKTQAAWKAALRKESDRVIVMPGQEKPLFMSSEMGKTFFQFRSFMFSATQRMLIGGIQGQDANYVGGLISLTSLGMMAYAFKQWDAGRPLSDDPRVWVTEGIDRSGSLGMLMEINNTVEKISNNNYGLRPLIGASAPASRFASRNQAEALLGPTFGSFLTTTLRVAGAGTQDREWSESDTRALRRLIPYQNLMLVRQAFDKIEKSIHR